MLLKLIGLAILLFVWVLCNTLFLVHVLRSNLDDE